MDCPEDGTTPFVPHGIQSHALHSGWCMPGWKGLYIYESVCLCVCVYVRNFFLIYVAER